MCMRPPCENCEAMYDACMSDCPKCGHPNQFAPDYSFLPKFEEVKREVWCKVCKINHIVIDYKVVEE